MAENQGGSRLSAATSMAATTAAVSSPSSSSSSLQAQALLPHSSNTFFVWREFFWGALAGGFGEGMMHPIDTVKTRIQSQAILSGSQHQKTVLQMIRTVWAADGLRGFYRGVVPGFTGSLATGATYFGVIESTKQWIEESHPNLGGHWAHFFAGGMGDTLGSFIYVPCEVIKQRMQVQGTRDSWSTVISNSQSGKIPGVQMYGYYNGLFHAGRSIWKEQGPKGLYAGYWSTLARDVPFAGLMVMFYEALKDMTDYGMKKWIPDADYQINSTLEGLVLGGVAGGLSAYVTTPLDVIKTRLQVQGPDLRYKGWFHAIHRTWMIEGAKGVFRGSIPRVIWYVPASALTFMAVEFLREKFNRGSELDEEEVASI
ncbi:uncharacterized protein [Spinacia oleracea]|uniref:Uncharacterized protein isoform X1 n=1 Tax=Spinacia oleracea TaxID=3562 RepID=A0A9R0K2Q6_SPIOL|nr:uncharacterized protein LOC110795644 isoform X1 [Spinacia oleracea]